MPYLLILRTIRLSPCATPAATDDMHINLAGLLTAWGDEGGFGSEFNVPAHVRFWKLVYIYRTTRGEKKLCENRRAVNC